MKLLQELEHDVSSNHQLAQIKAECQNFLAHPTQLLRGAKAAPQFIQKVSIRTDRRPLDANVVHSAIFNFLFKKQHGIEDVRMKAAFATQEHQRARKYGVVNWIIPTDACTLWVCEGISDTIAILDDIAHFATSLDLQSDWENAVRAVDKPAYSGDVIEYIEQHGTRENQQLLEQIEAKMRPSMMRYKQISPGSSEAIPSGEIMIVGPATYLINVDWAFRRFAVASLDDAFNMTVDAIQSA